MFPMKQYAVLFGQFVGNSKQGEHYSSLRCSDRRRASIRVSVCNRYQLQAKTLEREPVAPDIADEAGRRWFEIAFR